MAKLNKYDPVEHNKNLDKLRKEFGTKVTDQETMKVKPKTMEDLTSSMKQAPSPLRLIDALDLPEARPTKKDENPLHSRK